MDSFFSLHMGIYNRISSHCLCSNSPRIPKGSRQAPQLLWIETSTLPLPLCCPDGQKHQPQRAFSVPGHSESLRQSVAASAFPLRVTRRREGGQGQGASPDSRAAASAPADQGHRTAGLVFLVALTPSLQTAEKGVKSRRREKQQLGVGVGVNLPLSAGGESAFEEVIQANIWLLKRGGEIALPTHPEQRGLPPWMPPPHGTHQVLVLLRLVAQKPHPAESVAC